MWRIGWVSHQIYLLVERLTGSARAAFVAGLIYEALGADPRVVLAELPVVDDPGFNTRFMYFSLWHGKTMVNGYSGYVPSSYSALAPYLREFPRRFSVDALRRAGVTHVTLTAGRDHRVRRDPHADAAVGGAAHRARGPVGRRAGRVV